MSILNEHKNNPGLLYNVYEAPRGVPNHAITHLYSFSSIHIYVLIKNWIEYFSSIHIYVLIKNCIEYFSSIHIYVLIKNWIEYFSSIHIYVLIKNCIEYFSSIHIYVLIKNWIEYFLRNKNMCMSRCISIWIDSGSDLNPCFYIIKYPRAVFISVTWCV